MQASAARTSRQEIRFSTETLLVGRFEARPENRDFETAGAIGLPVFVFPRTSVWIEHEDRPAFVADPNWMTCFNAGQPYRRRHNGVQGDVSDYFRLRGDVLLDTVRTVNPRAEDAARPFAWSRLPVDAHACLLERRLFRALGLVEPFVAEEAALTILARVLAVGPTDGAPGGVRSRRVRCESVEHAKALLGRSFAGKLTLSDIADPVGCSQFHLSRIFKDHTGLTLHQYREQLRIRKAVTWLVDTNADVTDIALTVGYSTHSHFTWAFRRVFGTTPSAVRAAGRDGRWFASRLEAFADGLRSLSLLDACGR